jgi:hypothetical protein
MAGGGWIAWIMERNGGLFATVIQDMLKEIYMHVPLIDKLQVASMTAIFNLLGFHEFTVYAQVRDMSDIHRDRLAEQFNMYVKTVEQAQQAAEQEQQGKGEEKKSNLITLGKDAPN